MRAVLLVLTVLLVVSWSPKLSAALVGVPGADKGDGWNNAGYVLLNKHDYTNAKKYFNTAIREAPYQWRGYYNRAVVFYTEKNWQAALADLNMTIHLESAFFQATWMRSAVYRQMHNYPAYLKDLDTLARVYSQTGTWKPWH